MRHHQVLSRIVLVWEIYPTGSTALDFASMNRISKELSLSYSAVYSGICWMIGRDWVLLRPFLFFFDFSPAFWFRLLSITDSNVSRLFSSSQVTCCLCCSKGVFAKMMAFFKVYTFLFTCIDVRRIWLSWSDSIVIPRLKHNNTIFMVWKTDDWAWDTDNQFCLQTCCQS